MLAADDAARALANGWLAHRPGDDVRLLPLADGGEGTQARCARSGQVSAEKLDEPTEAFADVRSDARDDGDRRLPDLQDIHAARGFGSPLAAIRPPSMTGGAA
ncbi:glycerate kinase [Micromonospora sp. AMSO31t]|nr:glycerate kinase [Micromonospora sp. AMSO31t]KAB1913029.1 glycerate kinase [Micromonospora sp. AMSO31t]